MSKLLSQNGKILITSAGALAIESTGGGGYDITATENEDGTQSLAIVDGQGGSSGGTTNLSSQTITFKNSTYDPLPENFFENYYINLSYYDKNGILKIIDLDENFLSTGYGDSVLGNSETLSLIIIITNYSKLSYKLGEAGSGNESNTEAAQLIDRYGSSTEDYQDVIFGYNTIYLCYEEV